MAARLTDHDRILRAITEREWQTTVERLMTAHGWHWYHPADNSPRVGKGGQKWVQNVRAGFPDLVAVKGARMLAAELKREVGVVSPEQKEWLARLALAGVECHVWRPRDKAEVVRVLAGKTTS